MIQNIEEKKPWEDFKKFFFKVIADLLKLNQPKKFFFIILFEIIGFFPSVSILFRSYPFEPDQVNIFFNTILLSNDVQMIQNLSGIIQICLAVFMSFINVLLACQISQSPWIQTKYLMGYFIKVIKIFYVPFLFVAVEFINIFIKGQENRLIIQILHVFYFISTIMAVGFLGGYIFLEIRPFRSKNIMWNYTNTPPFFNFICNCIRVFCFYYNPDSISFLLISLFMLLCMKDLEGGPFNTKVRIIKDMVVNFHICAHVSIILSIFLNMKSVGFIIFSCSLLFCLFLGISKLYNECSKDLYLPICSENPQYKIYEFYIDYAENRKNNIAEIGKIINTHRMICQDPKCFLPKNQSLGQLRLQDLQTEINLFLKKNRRKSAQSQILYELWKMETDQNSKLTKNMRKFSIHLQFIVSYVLGGTKSDPENKSKSMLKSELTFLNGRYNQNSKQKFFKNLYFSLQGFSQLSIHMNKTRPQLSKLTQCIIFIKNQKDNMITTFENIIKAEEISYACVQLYFKFVSCFMNPNSISKQMLQRLKRTKLKPERDDISELSEPTFLIEADTGIIDRTNCQAFKFLRSRRMDLKQKNFTSFILPQLKVSELNRLVQKNSECNEQFPLFFRIKIGNEQTFQCRNIIIGSTIVNNRKFFIIRAYKRLFNNNSIQILLDSNNQMVGSSQNWIILTQKGKERCRQNIQEVYNEKIKKQLQQLKDQKIKKIQFGDDYLVGGHIISKFCPFPKMKLITLNLVLKTSPSKNRKRISNIRLSYVQNSMKTFQFHYRQGEGEKLQLQGKHETNSANMFKYYQERQASEKVQTILVNLILPIRKQYEEGIKSYRLYDGDLYNIDLEDKQKYIEQFEGVKTGQKKSDICLMINKNCLIIILLTICVAMIVGGFILLSQINVRINEIEEKQQKIQFINYFSLNFNGIMSVMRDIANGMFDSVGKDADPLIQNYYDDIQRFVGVEIFTDQVYKSEYNFTEYTGNLNELAEVCLSHIHEYMIKRDTDIIQAIHQFAIVQIGPRIDIQKDQLIYFINQQMKRIKSLSITFVVVIGFCSLIFSVGFLCLSYKFKKDLIVHLQPLLLTSEHQIRRLEEESQKFKTAIVGLSKNYQMDLQTINTNRQKNKLRSRPKQVSLGFSSFYCQTFFSFLFFAILIVLLSLININITKGMTNYADLFFQGQSIIEVYSEMSWISNKMEHVGKTQPKYIAQIGDKHALIQYSKKKFVFSTTLSQQIVTIFFEQSCPLLQRKNIVNSSICQQPIGNQFTLKKPFEIGLDYYLRRINYNLIQNITQTFASTGIYSQSFMNVFRYLSLEIEKETKTLIKKRKQQIQSPIILMLVASFIVSLCFFLTILYLKNYINNVKEALMSVCMNNEEKSRKQQDLQKNNQKEENENLEQSNANFFPEESQKLKIDSVIEEL